MKNKSLNDFVLKVITLIILTLYILLVYLDVYKVKSVIATDYIKYLCIILCFSLSIIHTKKLREGEIKHKNLYRHNANYRDRLMLQVGMGITVMADLCLVILNFYIIGIILFSMVQMIYSVRYDPENKKPTLINFLIIFQCIMLLYFIVNLYFKEINILVPIVLFYSICLIISIIKAIKAFNNKLYPSPNKYMIVLGMILFLLCDICVALSNITEIFSNTVHFIIILQKIASCLIWVWYVPSQLLLALSGIDKV